MLTPHYPRSTRRGFTLVELGIVVMIIGVLLAFILAASYGSVEQARSRATQALITKLELGVNERLNALLSQPVAPTNAHQWIAQDQAIVNNSLVPSIPNASRAQVIATIDMVRAEFPDVFFVQNDPMYPINFAGLPAPGAALGVPGSISAPYCNYALPIGTATAYGQGNQVFWIGSPGPGAGMLGASYNARAALHKSIGLSPFGTDGVDNNGDGLVDDYFECTHNSTGAVDSDATAAFTQFVSNHKHETARAELLYALLVNGSGPLGSVFEASEFRNNVEVKDTDNDGAPEFVDAWGKPIQFFRWPIYYFSSAVQKGASEYSLYEPRARFQLDPASRLVAPAWWARYNNGPPYQVSQVASQLFEPFFTSLSEPNFPASAQGHAWDLAGIYPRREFACKFLILSAGADQEYGVALLSNDQVKAASSTPDLLSHWLNGYPNPTNSIMHANGSSSQLGVIGESYAVFRNGYPLTNTALINANLIVDPSEPSASPPNEAGDDLSNHELLNQGGGLR